MEGSTEDQRSEEGGQKHGEQKEGRAQKGVKENNKEQKGGRNPPSMYFIVYMESS